MLNLLRPALNRVLTPVVEALARTPVTPNAITVTGAVGMAAGALWLFPTGHLFAGTVVCTIFVLSDMLDGALARVKGTTGAWGAFLDSTLDRIADAAVFAGLTVVHKNEGVSHQKSAVPIHLSHIDRIPRPVTSRVRGIDMAEPVLLSVRMPQ